jgi:hypothetical protein
VKRLLGENDVAAALQRLDRLCQYEAWGIPAQALEIDCGPIQNSSLVTDGEKLPSSDRAPSFPVAGGESADNVRYALRKFRLRQ